MAGCQTAPAGFKRSAPSPMQFVGSQSRAREDALTLKTLRLNTALMVLEKRWATESTAPGSVFAALELACGLPPPCRYLPVEGVCGPCDSIPTSLLSSLFLSGRQAVLPSPQPPHASHQVSTCRRPTPFTPPPPCPSHHCSSRCTDAYL